MAFLNISTSTKVGFFDKIIRIVGSIILFYLAATRLNLQDFGKFQAAVSLAVVAQCSITLSLRGYLTDMVSTNCDRALESFLAHFKLLFLWGCTICLSIIIYMDPHSILNWMIVSFLIAKLLEPIYYLYDADQKSNIYLKINLLVYIIMTLAKIITLFHSEFKIFLFMIIVEQLIIVASQISYIVRVLEIIRPHLKRISLLQVKFRVLLKVAMAGFLVVAYSKSDIIMLSLLSSDADVGVYSVAQKFFELILIVPLLFTLYEFPKIKSLLNNSDGHGEQLFIKISRKFFHIVTLASIFSVICSSILIHTFFGEAFSGAVQPAFILITSAVISTIGTLFSRYAYHLGLINYLFIKSLIALLLNVLANFLLIPIYGLIGAAFGTFISVLIADIVLDYFLADGYKMRRLKREMILRLK